MQFCIVKALSNTAVICSSEEGWLGFLPLHLGRFREALVSVQGQVVI